MLPFPVDIPYHETQAVYVQDARTWQLAASEPTPIKSVAGNDRGKALHDFHLVAPPANLTATVLDGKNKPAWMVGKKPLRVIYFAYDSAVIDITGKSELTALPTGCYHAVGFADPRGAADYNLKLSLRRAEAVADFIARNWSKPDAFGMGELKAKPYEQDRRVEVYSCEK